jgi:DNA-directed RNA polymerase subunit RPC12/RpoP
MKVYECRDCGSTVLFGRSGKPKGWGAYMDGKNTVTYVCPDCQEKYFPAIHDRRLGDGAMSETWGT